MNEIHFVGRVKDDPAMGRARDRWVCRFDLVVRRSKRAGEARKTDALPIVCLDHVAEFADTYLVAGRLVSVVGQARAYTTADRATGELSTVIAFRATRIEPLDRSTHLDGIVGPEEGHEKLVGTGVGTTDKNKGR